jgi:hypothetical protein
MPQKSPGRSFLGDNEKAPLRHSPNKKVAIPNKQNKITPKKKNGHQ